MTSNAMGSTPRNEITVGTLAILHEIAPDIEVESIDPMVDIRDQVDIDSIDFLTLMIGIHEHFGVDVPEAEYGRVTTLDALVDYIEAHCGASSG